MLTTFAEENFQPSSQRPDFIEQLRAESRGLPYRPAKRKKSTEKVYPSPENAHGLFHVADGNRWMDLARREPGAKMLFGELWHQNELCMLFADTNIGKSVLAVQIGDSIARGQGIADFACEAPPARVLYLDFELNRVQFGQRYSNGEEDHQFSKNFFRAEYNVTHDVPPNVDKNDLLIAAIEYKIKLVKATVLIIDNITCLRGGTENSAVALSLMKSLKQLKTEHKLSILVLAHTPKRRNPTQPLSADDLHGSKLLINFADSAFALGKSTVRRTSHGGETGLCYLKQIKQRNTRQRYGPDNVALCRIQKPGAFLHFVFDGYSTEHQHLLSRSAIDRQEFAHKIADLAAAGLSQREISSQLGIGLATVNRILRCVQRTPEGADGEEFEDLKISQFENDEECSGVQMRECADEGEFENLKISQFEDDEECSGVQMRECADEGEFENLKMCKFENEEECSGVKMRECADEGEFEDLKMCKFENEERYADRPMDNEVMTNDQNRCAAHVRGKTGLTNNASPSKTTVYEKHKEAPG